MKNTKPVSSHGIVVANKESGLYYASLDSNFDPDSERYIRDLRIGESVFSYSPKSRVDFETAEQEREEAEEALAQLTETEQEADRQAAASRPATPTEGAASADSPEKKEGN